MKTEKILITVGIVSVVAVVALIAGMYVHARNTPIFQTADPLTGKVSILYQGGILNYTLSNNLPTVIGVSGYSVSKLPTGKFAIMDSTGATLSTM